MTAPSVAIPTAPPAWRAVLLTAEASPARSAGTDAIGAATTAGVRIPSPSPRAGRQGGSRHSASRRRRRSAVRAPPPNAASRAPSAAADRGARSVARRPATERQWREQRDHASPASGDERPCTAWRKSVSTNSIPSVPKFIAPATALAAPKSARRRSLSGASGRLGTASRQGTRRGTVAPRLRPAAGGAAPALSMNANVTARQHDRAQDRAGHIQASRPVSAAPRHDTGRDQERDRHDRDIEEEDPAPTGPAHQRPGQQRPAGSAALPIPAHIPIARACSRGSGNVSLMTAKAPGEQESGADALHGARCDQRPYGGRRRAAQGCRPEEGKAAHARAERRADLRQGDLTIVTSSRTRN